MRLLFIPIKTFCLLVILFCILSASAQKKTDCYKSVYVYNYPGLKMPLPDKLAELTGNQSKEMEISFGALYYYNYYQDGFSRTNMEVQLNPGIQGNVSGPLSGSYFSRKRDSAFFYYEENELKQQYRFQLPVMVKTNETKTIKGYSCQAYEYTEGDSVRTIVWFSEALPFAVSPGVYYERLGGIVQLDFYRNDEHWSIELQSYEKTKEQIDFKKELHQPKESRKNHFLFRR